MNLFGYAGRIGRIDLSTGKMMDEELEEEDARKFLGGRGLAGKTLLEELNMEVDPLGPKNMLLFLTGPLTGTGYQGCGKHLVSAKSPLTGFWGESTSGGYWGPYLKFAGYDGLIIEGKASSPVYLWVHDGEIEIRDASRLWGKNTVEATKHVREETDGAARVACIGPGGEKLVRYASIIHDMNHAAGRSGLGAVMGSKKLKLVSVHGKKKLRIANHRRFRELLSYANQIIRESPVLQNFRMYGTSGDVESMSAMGILPTKYFQTGTFSGCEKISGQTMAETILVKRTTCMGCPVACIRAVRVDSGRHAGVTPETGGPQYETIGSLGSLCLNNDLRSIAMGHQLCNLYGLDSIATGNIVAFLMECQEKGLLRKNVTDEIEFRWGDADCILQTIRKIGEREGFGDILAEGVARASEKIGKGAARLAMHVKGMEIPLHEPRGKKALGLAYAVSPRGACHLVATHDTSYSGQDGLPEVGLEGRVDRFAIEGKGRFVKITQDLMAVCNSAVICRFHTAVLNPANIPMTLITEMLAAATGWDITFDELCRIGERAVNLTRVFNVKLGAGRKDDALPARFSDQIPEGSTTGQKISKEDLDKMLDEYYLAREWDSEGIPTEDKLTQLQIRGLAGRLN